MEEHWPPKFCEIFVINNIPNYYVDSTLTTTERKFIISLFNKGDELIYPFFNELTLIKQELKKHSKIKNYQPLHKEFECNQSYCYRLG